MQRILLDTNAYSALLLGDETVMQHVGQAKRVYLSIVVIAELYYGFIGGTREKNNRTSLSRFIARPTVRVLHTTLETATLFATIKDALRQKGQKIPINDVWIAAHTLEVGARLVTRDAHFERIESLRLFRF